MAFGKARKWKAITKPTVQFKPKGFSSEVGFPYFILFRILYCGKPLLHHLNKADSKGITIWSQFMSLGYNVNADFSNF